jgi:outer membrane protein assembly factor BamA
MHDPTVIPPAPRRRRRCPAAFRVGVRALAALVLCWLLPGPGVATAAGGDGAEPADPAGAPEAATAAQPRLARSGWLYVLPVAAYSPETKFAFGASAGRFYRFGDDPAVRPTTATPLALLTTEGQVILGLFADAWWDANRWHLVSNLGFSRFPTQFYGVGDATRESAEEDYTPSNTTLLLEAKRRVTGGLYLGGILDVRHTSIEDTEAGGLLETGGFYGAAGGSSVGVGMSAAWDTRDAVYYPTGGWWNRVAVTRFLDVLGGDHVYTWLDASLARYWSLGDRRVLAARLSGSFVSGGRAPFNQLPRLMLRGYFEERYLENHVVRAQVEYRTGLWKRLGAVVFAGVGELAATTDQLRLDEALPVGGFGLRFDVRSDETANLRLDFGFGDGDNGVYIRFGEAF